MVYKPSSKIPQLFLSPKMKSDSLSFKDVYIIPRSPGVGRIGEPGPHVKTCRKEHQGCWRGSLLSQSTFDMVQVVRYSLAVNPSYDDRILWCNDNDKKFLITISGR